MTCIKTGLNAYFRNYGTIVRADLYMIGDVLLIKWNVNSVEYTPSDKDADLVVEYIEDSEKWFHRPDLGITVVPQEYCTRWCT
jgi:hypothetical protein